MNATTHRRRSSAPARRLLAAVPLLVLVAVVASLGRTLPSLDVGAVVGVALLVLGMGAAAALPFAVVAGVVAVLERRPEP